MELTKRPRRLRGNSSIRKLVRETRMSPESLVYPVFFVEGEHIQREIPSLPGQYHWSVDRVPVLVDQCLAHGVSRLLLFGIPDHKDGCASAAYDPEGIIQRAIRAIKAYCPEMYVITDVCMCEYTDHGHCGILAGREVDNDKTLEVLAKIVLSHVEAGADMVAPSDMMDGRIAAIRKTLDEHGHQTTPILSYAAKYASAFYGPFRDAAGSAPAFGDRQGYQMDPHNAKEALKECDLDVEEGADILMVKPALPYLDVLRRVADRYDLPVCAYAVS
ncbi:MAG: porphobilinogen synthase, partial [Clostridiales bacterium]|nr:porphobilinogen synthase [Clostridiales bacterium]